MDRLHALRVFAAVAQRQSFAEAARHLGISPTASSRAVRELERELGVPLLRRTTRAVRLTQEGSAYLERCKIALDELEDAERLLRGENAEPRGRLNITAPVVFGRLHVLPIIAGLLRAHPALDAQLMLSDRFVNMVEEGIDVAVRIGTLTDSTLYALHLTDVRRVLVASPAYLAQHGTPFEVADLRHHALLAFDAFSQNGEWRFGTDGRTSLRVQPRLLTNSVETTIDAALDGLGIARALSYQVEDHISAGRLFTLLPEQEPSPIPVSLFFQSNRQRAPNVRALVVAARAYFRARQSNPDA